VQNYLHFFLKCIDFWIAIYYNLNVSNPKGEILARTGRPTQDPKSKQFRIRLTETEFLKLAELSQELNLTKSDTIRYCINLALDKKKSKA
jgi:macrodomain Ter protein organizer (MatP/YcbG family)